MNPQNIQVSDVRKNIKKSSAILPILIAFLVVAIIAIMASITRVISISGHGDSFILKPNQIRVGILFIDEGATAFFQQDSHWFGPIISKEGELIIQDDVSITGPVILFSNSLDLGVNASVDGNVVLFAGSLIMKPGAVVRHNVVLFAGSAVLGQGASVRGNMMAFAGSVALQEKASLRGNALLFAGSMQVGPEAVVYGKPILFAGGLDLAQKAVVRDDAILFAGNAHLFPQAQVRGDVILVEGNATLDSQSTISGKVYLNPDARKGMGNLYSSSEAQVLRGVAKPENIEAVASRHIAGSFLGFAMLLVGLFVAAVVLLMALMFYLGRRSKASTEKVEAQSFSPQTNPQSSTPGMR